MILMHWPLFNVYNSEKQTIMDEWGLMFVIRDEFAHMMEVFNFYICISSSFFNLECV